MFTIIHTSAEGVEKTGKREIPENYKNRQNFPKMPLPHGIQQSIFTVFFAILHLSDIHDSITQGRRYIVMLHIRKLGKGGFVNKTFLNQSQSPSWIYNFGESLIYLVVVTAVQLLALPQGVRTRSLVGTILFLLLLFSLFFSILGEERKNQIVVKQSNKMGF